MIFEEQITRKPDNYPWTQEFIEAMHNGFWTHKEFNFQSDIQDFRVNLNDQERTIITRALSTIGQLEISVKKFWAKLGDNLPHPSINDMGYVMANIEVIHGDAYERLLEVLGIDDSFEEILKLDMIKGRVNYLRKHLHKFHNDNKKQFIYSLILFTLFVENIALFSQFYTIGFFSRFKNFLKDTNKQVEYTSREENPDALSTTINSSVLPITIKSHPQILPMTLFRISRWWGSTDVTICSRFFFTCFLSLGSSCLLCILRRRNNAAALQFSRSQYLLMCFSDIGKFDIVLVIPIISFFEHCKATCNIPTMPFVPSSGNP
jgi:ribonucleotide reductase beta subunit family protein with ferritin-like domain